MKSGLGCVPGDGLHEHLKGILLSKTSVTLVDVAKHAGVALVTTSRALNHTGFVSEETRKKVVASAKALGYMPNLSAKILKGGKPNLLGLVVTNMQSAVINEIISGVAVASKQAGMDLIIYIASSELGEPNRRDIDRALGGLCEGVLLLMPTADDALLKEFEASSAPVVLINYWRKETKLPTVRGDNYAGARAAIEYLIGLGHSRIAFVSGLIDTGQSQERQRGYEDALKHAGIRMVDGLVVTGDFTQSSGFEAGLLLLTQPRLPTAIFAANDAMAFGVMDALKEKGFRIPGDISVVGFDDSPAANHVYPRLTSVRQPLSELSEQSVRLLLQQIRARAAKKEADEQLIVLPSELVIRDSCGPAPDAHLG